VGERERAIRITAGPASAEAVIDRSRTAAAIWKALPVAARAETWGDEIYFDVGIALEPESPRAAVNLGDLGYWPPGRAFCIFFGPTPMSADGEIRPASPVNVFGHITGDPTVFKRVRAGTPVRIERAGGEGR
jgi:hypothetical protein